MIVIICLLHITGLKKKKPSHQVEVQEILYKVRTNLEAAISLIKLQRN